MSNAADEYAEAVLAGDTVAGPYVRAACRRHQTDSKRVDLVYDSYEADRVYRFFTGHLRLSKGKYEGEQFELLPWQRFVLGSLFGWYRVNAAGEKVRRFQKAYIETAKGSGKSPLLAGIGLFGTVADNEAGAENYVIARNLKQTKAIFQSIDSMVEQSPDVFKRLLEMRGGSDPNRYTNTSKESSSYGSFIERSSTQTQGKGKSGPIPHFIIVDEYHEHDTSDMVDFYEAGTKIRENPLTVIITNAGIGDDSPCGLEHQYAIEVAKGEKEDDSYFSYVCGLDDGDNPYRDEACWPKVNPGLPAIPGTDYLQGRVKRVSGLPSKKAGVDRLNFCIWTDAASPWLDLEKWIEAEVEELDETALEAAPCFIGLDLSLKTDLTAGALVWSLDGSVAARVKVWTPKDTLTARAATDRAPYVQWAEEGHLTAVPGKTLRHDSVAKWIGEVSERYNLQGIAYDPAKIDLLHEQLEEQGIVTTLDPNQPGIYLVPHPQGFTGGIAQKKEADKVRLWMPQSIEDFEQELLDGGLQIERNPCLRRAASGAVVKTDESDNRRFIKKKSTARIDPLVALVMGIGFCKASKAGPSKKAEAFDVFMKALRHRE